jgi:AP endonuclease-2
MFQLSTETKTGRRQLDATTATPGKYYGFFSFPALKTGYSGVAVYTNSEAVVPLKAEEGLSGLIQPKPPLSPEERISSRSPDADNMDFMADGDGNTVQATSSLVELDNEGRALVIDFGLFVLINLYCVADSADVRYHYKMNFYFLLQEKVRILLEEGREVIVLGDMNSCPAPIDHCEGMMPRHRESFMESPHRKWLNNWIAPSGPLIDIVRKRWPGREGMFTCKPNSSSHVSPYYSARFERLEHKDFCSRWELWYPD